MIEVKFSGMGLDKYTNQPVIFLKEVGGDRVLRIWIGVVEASAIAYVLEGKEYVRPLTIDLMKRIIDGMGGKVIKVMVTAIKENTFYATVVLKRNGRLISIDARPSDSIALALRSSVPIFVAEDVMDSAVSLSTDEEEKIKEIRERLKRTDPEKFGDYPL